MSYARDLQAKQRARILDLICEGQVAGLCAADGTLLSYADRNKGILLDLTPVKNADGTSAMANIATDFRTGTAHQTYITGFPSSEQEVTVEEEVKKGADKWTNAVQRQIPAGSHNAVRVSVRIPALYQYDAQGNRNGAAVHFSIQLRRSAEVNWQEIVGSNPDGYQSLDGLIQGEALSPYVRSYRIPLYGEGPWDIRIGKETSDSTDPAKLQSSLIWQSYTLITDQRLTFRHSCVGAIELNAEQQSRILPRAYRLKGMLVRVPSNYNTETRSYAGVWDGKFAGCDLSVASDYTAGATSISVEAIAAALPDNSLIRFVVGGRDRDARLNGDHAAGATSLAISPLTVDLASGATGYGYHLKWTNNPAWVFFDVATHSRYGLGAYIPEATIDKWALYSISRYSDGVDSDGNFVGVPDGKGGYEPRFACSAYIATSNDAFRVISDLASVFRAMVYWGAGYIVAVQDSPKDPKFNFTNANVINGIFTYSSAARKARHTMAYVRWNDPDDYSRPKMEQVPGDDDDIDRLGYRELNIAAFGCMSRAQAIRVGKWALLTEKYESETVAFRTGLEGARCRPGDIIRIRDRHKTVNRMGGRIKAVDGEAGTLELDSTVVIGASEYTLVVTREDGTSAQLPVTGGAGTRQVLAVTGELDGIVPNAVWILTSEAVAPTLWRVANVKEIERQTFEVSATQYVPAKFDTIEEGIALTVPQTSDWPPIVRPEAVSDISVTETFVATAEKSERFLNVSWTAAEGDNIRGYRCEMRAPGKEWTLLAAFTTALSIPAAAVSAIGSYEVRVTTLGYYQLESLPSVTTYELAEAPALDEPEDFAVHAILGGFRLTWTAALMHRGYYRVYVSETSTKPETASAVVPGELSEWLLLGFSAPSTRYFWLEPVYSRIDFAGASAGPESATSIVGANAIVGVLSNETQTLPATSAGVVTTFAAATATMKVYDGGTDATDEWSFAKTDHDVTSSLSGSTVTVSALSEDSGYVEITASRDGYDPIIKRFVLSKAKAGTDGSNGDHGVSSATVLIYQRAASAPSVPSDDATYTFATGELTGLDNGWSQSIPSGTLPVWAASAAAASTGATDTITSEEWATPVLIAKNGEDGVGTPGANGLNSAAVYLFQRTATASAPSVPDSSVTYTFATGETTGVDNGWTRALPTSGGPYRWMILASALSASATDTIATGEWSTPALLAEDGATGAASTAYWLVGSVAAISKSGAGAYTPSSITISAKAQTGAGAPAAYAGRFVIADTTNGSSYTDRYTSSGNESSKSYTPGAGIVALRCRLYLAGGTSTLLDEQVIPIVADGTTVDQTVPSNPAAPTLADSGWNVAADGAVYSWLSINLPSLPAGAASLSLLYRRHGTSEGWNVAYHGPDGDSAQPIDDLAPDGSYDVAVMATNHDGVPSSVVAATGSPFVAPKKDEPPGGLTNIAAHSPDSSYPIPARYSLGPQDFGCTVTFDPPDDLDYAGGEWAASPIVSGNPTPTTGAPFGPSERQFLFYFPFILGMELWTRTKDRTGNWSAWVDSGINLTSYVRIPAGSLSEQDSDDVAITGIRTGGSGAQKVRTRYPFNAVVILDTPASAPTFNISISGKGFTTKPDGTTGVINVVNSTAVKCSYNWDDAGNTSTNAVVTLTRYDGANVGNGAYRITGEFFELY
jgi:predicted phage tail protein